MSLQSKLQVKHLPGPEEIAEAAARQLLGLLLRRSDLAAPFGVALSGGRIAAAFYQAIMAGLRELERSSRHEAPAEAGELFENVHFFWADERCVAPNDPENNYRVAREYLLAPLGISSEQVHRIRGEIDESFAVSEAEAELCRLMPLTESGQPVLDLVILGMGEDGHVASLFPEESPAILRDERVYRPVTATKPPPRRITLGYQPILAAREAWVLASGAGKAPALRRLLAADEQLPITRVVMGRPQTLFLQDIEENPKFL